MEKIYNGIVDVDMFGIFCPKAFVLLLENGLDKKFPMCFTILEYNIMIKLFSLDQSNNKPFLKLTLYWYP